MTKVNKELVELKYGVLQKRITDTQDTLELMNKLIPCSNDIKSMEIISQQYEKMYQAIIQSGEYEKYEEVENIIVAQFSKIEAKLDRMIYRLSSQYPKYFESIEQSENYKNFHGLDIELEKLYALKELLIKCRIFHSQEQQNNLKEKVLDLRFRVLVRRQVEQMIYESHSTKSWLSSRRAEEVFYFTPRIREMVKRIKDVKSDILYSYGSRAIIDDSILINHLIFKLLEQEIEENPQKYIGLLQAPIFNPHLCNIANDSFGKKDIVVNVGGGDMKFFSRPSNVNLSLLIGVLKGIINEENTTIIECNNIYKRFGFECRPIVVNEGQEIIRQLFEKVKHTIKTEAKSIWKSNGPQVRIQFSAYDYKFNPQEVPFYTNAQIRDCNLNIQRNEWRQVPLEELEITTALEPAEPPFYLMLKGDKDADALWTRYRLDFLKLGIRINQVMEPTKVRNDFGQEVIVFDVSMNLGDIEGLPIDYKKIIILDQDREKRNEFEEAESLKEGLEH